MRKDSPLGPFLLWLAGMGSGISNPGPRGREPYPKEGRAWRSKGGYLTPEAQSREQHEGTKPPTALDPALDGHVRIISPDLVYTSGMAVCYAQLTLHPNEYSHLSFLLPQPIFCLLGIWDPVPMASSQRYSLLYTATIFTIPMSHYNPSFSQLTISCKYNYFKNKH